MRSALIPILLGALAAGQGMLNRNMATHVGLSVALVLSTLGVLAGALVLVALVRVAPQLFPAFILPAPGWTQQLAWWFVLPGLLGILFIAGVPWSIHHAGAAHTFSLAIFGQVGLGFLWDTMVQKVPVTTPKAIGAVLLLAGASLILRGD